MPELLQGAVLSVVSFIVVLSLVVFVHEFGHFQVGRWCGIAVKSFSIGLGSEMFGWTDRHGTRWKVSQIPLGGFVSWVDDTDGSSLRPATEEDQALSDEEARRRGHFRAQPLWKRAATVAAGPMTNFVFAIAAFAAVAMVAGRDLTNYENLTPRIGEVRAGTAASEAGLRSGEVVRAINGDPVSSWGEFQRVVTTSPNTPITLTLEQDGAERSVVVTPRLAERPSADGSVERVGMIGVTLGVVQDERVIEQIAPVEALQVGARNTWAIIANTSTYLAGIFSGQNSGSEISGPLGILTASGQVATMALDAADQDIWAKVSSLLTALLQWAAILSVAVGFVNLLPIPILDGGHLVFYGIEALRGGRPLPPTAQEWAFRAGFAVMASLFLFATWNDIIRLFPGAQ